MNQEQSKAGGVVKDYAKQTQLVAALLAERDALGDRVAKLEAALAAIIEPRMVMRHSGSQDMATVEGLRSIARAALEEKTGKADSNA